VQREARLEWGGWSSRKGNCNFDQLLFQLLVTNQTLYLLGPHPRLCERDGSMAPPQETETEAERMKTAGSSFQSTLQRYNLTLR
jgi:hypothetical protein